MKRTILLMAALYTGLHASAQETVSMGSGYSNENYYSLSSGDEISVVRDNWDIAFASDGLGSSSSTIRINGSIGTELYLFSNDTADWGSLDTTGFQWSQLINSETDWSTGAFQNQTPASGFDLGWGTYNSITHIVSGDRIFLLKLANGAYKKLIIDQLTGGEFTFHYADLDGSNLVETSVSKSNYAGKNFGYLKTIPHMAGVVIGFLSLLIVLSLGLISIFITYPFIQTILQIAGSIYLLYL